jgi:nitrogen fixation protein
MDRYNNNRLATDPPMKMDQAITKAQQYRADAGTKSDAERLAAQTALSTNSQLARGVTGARNQFAAKTLAKAKVLADGITADATVTAAKTRATAVKAAADLSDTRENNRQRHIDQASRRKSLSSIYTNDNSSTSQIMATESQLESLKDTPGYERLKREYDQGIQKSVLSVLRERTDAPAWLSGDHYVPFRDNETPGINADVEDLAQQLVLSSNGQKVAFRDASGEGTVGEWVDLTTEIPHATLKWIQKQVGKATHPASSNSPDGVIKFGSGLNKDKQEVLNGAPITSEERAAFALWKKGNK